MNLFVESLKRLYKDNKVDINKLKQLVIDKKIKETELSYILEEGGNDVHNIN